jgi:hypothetical protein
MVLKCLDFVRGQGAIWFESGAYTIVREHFGPDRNAAIGQKMKVLKPFLHLLRGRYSQKNQSVPNDLLNS